MNETTIKQKAIDTYASADAAGKEILTKVFGPETFIPKITDRIQTFADVEEITGIKLIRREDETNDEFAYRKVKLIAVAYNEGKAIEVNNLDQYKYYPWFEVKAKTEFGLVYHGTYYWTAYTHVGSQLCFLNSDHAKDASTKFTEIYSQLLIK